MHPILIDLGFWQVPTYGVLLALAVIAALWTARRRARRAGLDGDRIVDFGLWLVIWALLGSKLLLVLVELPRFVRNPAEVLTLVRAGGVFLGGFIAGIIAAFVLIRRYRLPALRTLDVLVPSLSLGQAIGRLGCLAAGCCWGAECRLPWAIEYSNPVAAETLGTPLHVPLHPFPVYAFLCNLGLYLVFAWMFRMQLKTGRVFGAYLVLYGAVRFLLEWTRGDAVRGFVFHDLLSTSQFISVLMVAGGIGLQIWVTSRNRG